MHRIVITIILIAQLTGSYPVLADDNTSVNYNSSASSINASNASNNSLSNPNKSQQSTLPGGAEYSAGAYPGAVLMPIQVWLGANKPGVYEVPVRTDLTLLLSYTGGPLPTSLLDQVVIRRTSKGKPQLIRVDLEKLFQEPQRLSPVLEPNDIVYIPVKKPLIDPDVAQTIGVLGVIATMVFSGVIASSYLHH